MNAYKFLFIFSRCKNATYDFIALQGKAFKKLSDAYFAMKYPNKVKNKNKKIKDNSFDDDLPPFKTIGKKIT
jgi:hypothetical protein